MPQRSSGNSRRHSPAISAICAAIHGRPPPASVARDSRRTIAAPSNTAMLNFVPPMSIARIIASHPPPETPEYQTSIFQSKNDTEIDFRFQRKVILKRQAADERLAAFLLSFGRNARGFGFAVRKRDSQSPSRASRGSVGNRSLVFLALPRGDAWRWECGNLAVLARFPRGGGKRGKPVRGFPRFPPPRHFHGPVVAPS